MRVHANGIAGCQSACKAEPGRARSTACDRANGITGCSQRARQDVYAEQLPPLPGMPPQGSWGLKGGDQWHLPTARRH